MWLTYIKENSQGGVTTKWSVDVYLCKSNRCTFIWKQALIETLFSKSGPISVFLSASYPSEDSCYQVRRDKTYITFCEHGIFFLSLRISTNSVTQKRVENLMKISESDLELKAKLHIENY